MLPTEYGGSSAIAGNVQHRNHGSFGPSNDGSGFLFNYDLGNGGSYPHDREGAQRQWGPGNWSSQQQGDLLLARSVVSKIELTI